MTLVRGFAALARQIADVASVVAGVQDQLLAAGTAAEVAQSLRDAGDEEQAEAALAAGFAQLAEPGGPDAALERRAFEQTIARLSARIEAQSV